MEDLAPFRDPALRALVERTLGKDAGAPITEADLQSLTELHGRGLGIRDLAGLESATGLRVLDLSYNYVADVSPLSGLAALEVLLLWSNRISDVSPLAQLTSLRRLTLGNEIRDVSPLSALVDLEYLELSSNAVTDLTPLSGLSALERLYLQDNNVTELAPLSGLTGLTILGLRDNDVSDVSPLSELAGLQSLYLSGNPVSDLSPLSGLTTLSNLRLVRVEATDFSALGDLTSLRSLLLDGNGISDLAMLSELDQLRTLSLVGNSIADLSALSGLTSLESLELDGNDISDLTVLSELTTLRSLDIDDNMVSDLSPLSGLTRLRRLNLNANRVSDLSPLSGLPDLSELRVGGNDISLQAVLALPNRDGFEVLGLAHLGISDVAPLAALTGIFVLNLRGNEITDIGPLVDARIWPSGGHLYLEGNPLDDAFIKEHVPKLSSLGVGVSYYRHDGSPRVSMPDPSLRALVAQQAAGNWVLVDAPITESSISVLRVLYAFNAGVSDLAGLEAAPNLVDLWLAANAVSDVTAISRLAQLRRVDLTGNLVTDVSPLVENGDFAGQVSLSGNPLSEESVNTHIPALLERGVTVTLDSITLTVTSGRETTFDMAGYFAALLGSDVEIAAESDDPDIASAEIPDGVLTLAAGAGEGTVAVTLTATNDAGENATLTVEVTVAHAQAVAMYPSASAMYRQGFLRVINRSDEAGAVFVRAVDDAGVAASTVVLAMNAGTTTHFNSDDLEDGNRAKRLSGATGAGTGDWRLELSSGLDVEVLSYVRTTDGFLTSMHDVAPGADGVHRVRFFNPGSNLDQVSLLRLINPGGGEAAVTIAGVDDRGSSPGTDVVVTVPSGAVRTLSSADLEAGEGVEGALGDGAGKWSLTVTSDRGIRVMSLLESPGGHLANLSTVPVAEGGVHFLPLFPAASDELGRQGFARVINRADSEAEVSISAFDETDRDYDTVTLSVGGNNTVHFNSDDLELGNEDKGLTGSTGAGEGDWRLELTGGADIEVLSYVRTTDGFLTSMHDVVSGTENRYLVPIFNPGRNTNQVSRLRLINDGDEPAQVTIAGVDDAGSSPGDDVRISIPAGSIRSFTSAELESGAADSEGALGVGVGKWRLIVESDRPITVVNLLESPTGHLTNLSTANPANEEANGGGGSDAD